MSSADVAGGRAAIIRARRRGASAAGFVLLISVGLVGAALSRAAGGKWMGAVPPGVLSLLLLSALVVATHAAVVEWRTPNSVDSARSVASRILPIVALLIGFPCAWVSIFLEVLANTPPECPAPVPVPGGIDEAQLSSGERALLDRCEQSTPAEVAGLITWAVVITGTAALLIAGLVMANRSRVVGWAAVPTAIAGCVIAFDLGHVVALTLRQS